MNHLLAFAAFLVLPLIGLGITRLEGVRRLDLSGRLTVAGAAGAAIVAAALALLSILHVAWTRGTVFAVVAILTGISVYAARRSPALQAPVRTRDVAATIGIVVFALLTGYGLLDARESCGDLHFFWGPKAIHFHYDGGVKVAFLADPNNIQLSPGYPLLLPLLYSWTLTVAREFSWWAAVLATALFLFGSVALVRSASGDTRGALMMAASLSYASAVAYAAGGAEPPLVFFETLTLVALTFLDDPRTRTVLAALGLAGAVMLKIEGTTFAIAVVIALLVIHRNLRNTLVIAAPAALLLAAWLGFVKANGLFEYYRGAGMPVYLASIPKTLLLTMKVAGYEVYGLPWLAPLLLLVLGRSRRAAALPALVALLTLGAAMFFYVHVPDPTWWILSSAPRVLLTPLTAFVIAGVAASLKEIEN
jgi:hypothetical protein